MRPRMEERLQGRIAKLTVFRSVWMIAVVALILAFAAAILEWLVDPAFSSLRNAFWWAIVTVTTTGYGDIVPTSSWGRVVASVLMIAGVSVIPLTTSIVVSILVSRAQAEQWKRDGEVRQDIVDRLDRVEELLARLDARG